MHAFLKQSGSWVRAGWFWPLVLLALPNCAGILGVRDWGPGGNGDGPTPFFEPGLEPRSSAIMCDIPMPAELSGISDCATDVVSGMPTEYAAVALAQGEQNM